MNENIDYKALYEEAQAKLDKIAYNKLKKRIDDTLGIKHNKMFGYNREEQLKRVQENESLGFIRRLDGDKVQIFINEIGYDKLWAIIKDIYQDVIVNNEEEAEWKKL